MNTKGARKEHNRNTEEPTEHIKKQRNEEHSMITTGTQMNAKGGQKGTQLAHKSKHKRGTT